MLPRARSLTVLGVRVRGGGAEEKKKEGRREMRKIEEGMEDEKERKQGGRTGRREGESRGREGRGAGNTQPWLISKSQFLLWDMLWEQFSW